MPYFKFDGLNVFYDTFSTGEPLLMLHGNSVSSKMFKSEIEFFSQFYQVIVFDYPGLGQSERVQQFRDDYWNYNAKCAFELMDSMKINKFRVIGTSGGALVGLNMAIIDTKRIVSLIADSFMGMGLSLEDSQKIVKRRTAAKSKLLEKAFWKTMNGEDWSNVVDQDIDLMDRCGKLGLQSIQGDLSSIESPTLCVATVNDELIPNIRLKVEKVCNQIPNSTLKIFDFGKHPFMITQKPEFRELARNFMNGIDFSIVS